MNCQAQKKRNRRYQNSHINNENNTKENILLSVPSLLIIIKYTREQKLPKTGKTFNKVHEDINEAL